MGDDDDQDFWKEYHWKSERAIKWWNELFRTEFVQFKRNLANIAARYYVHAPYDAIFQQLDYELLTSIDKLHDTWIFPTDEDDWPHPNLPNVLRRTSTAHHDYVLWDVHRICVLGRRCIRTDAEYYSKHIVLSNSYAIRPKERHAHMAYHGRLDHLIRNHDTRIKYLNRPLGIKVDNPSSLSLLVRCETKEMLATIAQQFTDELDKIPVPKVFQGGYDSLKEEMRKL